MDILDSICVYISESEYKKEFNNFNYVCELNTENNKVIIIKGDNCDLESIYCTLRLKYGVSGVVEKEKIHLDDRSVVKLMKYFGI